MFFYGLRDHTGHPMVWLPPLIDNFNWDRACYLLVYEAAVSLPSSYLCPKRDSHIYTLLYESKWCSSWTVFVHFRAFSGAVRLLKGLFIYVYVIYRVPWQIVIIINTLLIDRLRAHFGVVRFNSKIIRRKELSTS